MARDRDLVLWVLRAVCDRAQVKTNDVIEIERAARLEWGGVRVYVHKGDTFDRENRYPERTGRRWITGTGRGHPRKR